MEVLEMEEASEEVAVQIPLYGECQASSRDAENGRFFQPRNDGDDG